MSNDLPLQLRAIKLIGIRTERRIDKQLGSGLPQMVFAPRAAAQFNLGEEFFGAAPGSLPNPGTVNVYVSNPSARLVLYRDSDDGSSPHPELDLPEVLWEGTLEFEVSFEQPVDEPGLDSEVASSFLASTSLRLVWPYARQTFQSLVTQAGLSSAPLPIAVVGPIGEDAEPGDAEAQER